MVALRFHIYIYIYKEKKEKEKQETKCKRFCYNSYNTLTQLQESLICKKINAIMTEEWLHERLEL